MLASLLAGVIVDDLYLIGLLGGERGRTLGMTSEGLAEGETIVIGNYRAISRDLEDGSEVLVSEATTGGDSE